MDGRFVPNISFGPLIVKAVRSITKLPLDTHLMVEEPERSIDTYIRAGADLVTVHLEACLHLQRTLTQIRDAGARSGVALNPSTLPGLVEYVLDDLDLILVMSVNPGFGGQSFIPTTYAKLRHLRGLVGGRGIELSVDGGVGPGNAAALAQAGAGVLVAGSAIFGAPDPGEAVRILRSASEVAK